MPNRLQVTFWRKPPGGFVAERWILLVHHDARGGLMEAGSYSHPTLRGLYSEPHLGYHESSGSLKAFRGYYSGR